jgi:hypothetical protein
MKIIKSTSLIAIFCLYFIAVSYSQEFGKNALTYSAGIGFLESSSSMGMGEIFTVGYQRNLKNERLRFAAQINMSNNTTRLIMDARNQTFQSVTMNPKIDFDIITIKGLSIVASGGGFVNYLKGYKGTSSKYIGTTTTDSGLFLELNYGISTSLGLRLNPVKSRLTYEIISWNVNVGANNFIEFRAKMGVGVKL